MKKSPPNSYSKSMLTWDELKAIFDVLNVYDPNDICHVFPEMGTPEFIQNVESSWRKILAQLEKHQAKPTIAGTYHGASGSALMHKSQTKDK